MFNHKNLLVLIHLADNFMNIITVKHKGSIKSCNYTHECQLPAHVYYDTHNLTKWTAHVLLLKIHLIRWTKDYKISDQYEIE